MKPGKKTTGKSTVAHVEAVSARTRKRLAQKHKSMMNASNSLRNSTSMESGSNGTNLFDASITLIEQASASDSLHRRIDEERKHMREQCEFYF